MRMANSARRLSRLLSRGRGRPWRSPPHCHESSGTIYVHWPYCSRLCTYCNFNKYVRSGVDSDAMVECLVGEITSLLRLSGLKTVTSVYFGGGTPSLAPPSAVDTILSHIQCHAHLEQGAEVTLEANPTSAETAKLRAFKMAGVTRLSIGLQSLVDEDLVLMNRDHTVEQAKRSLSEAQRMFPDQTNVDVIFGRAGQSLSSWKTELKQLVEECGSHISLYQLTVEPGTPLARAVKDNQVFLPDSDVIADMYEEAVQVLGRAGLQRYEISHFCIPGYEGRHNLSYWKGCSYLGTGPGAHSRFYQPHSDHFCVQAVNTPEPNAWMAMVKRKGHGLCRVKNMSEVERLEEVIATSMRTVEGLTAEVWDSLSLSPPLSEVFSPRSGRLLHWWEGGMLAMEDGGMRATEKGLNLLDSMLPDILLSLGDHEHGKQLDL